MARKTEAISKVVGAEIRRARLDAGLTQIELARRLDVTAPYVANVEAGRGNPTVGQIAAIADALPARLHLELVAEHVPNLVIPAARST